MDLLPGFVLLPSSNGKPPNLVPCFIPKDQIQMADLPDVLQLANPPRKQPNNLKIQFDRNEDGTTKHESLNNPEVKFGDILPEFFLRVQVMEAAKTVTVGNKDKKVITIYLQNHEHKTYGMTAWGPCVEKLEGLEDGRLYKFQGIKAQENNEFTTSDLEYRFGFGPRSMCTLVEEK